MENVTLFGILFCVLALFMSIPQPGAGVSGNRGDNRTPVDASNNNGVPDDDANTPSQDARPVPACNGIHVSSQSCQNLAQHTVNEISTQIKMEFEASYVYMQMAAYFGRDDVAYHGFAKFFSESSDEEREHGLKFVNYLNKRGGRTNFKTIPSLQNQTWADPRAAILDALALEKNVNSALLDLHWDAQQKNDPHLLDFIESEFLTEQVDSIKQLSDWATILTRLNGDPLGLHQFDQELLLGTRK